MNISLVREGLLKERNLSAWTNDTQKRIRRQVADGMREAGPVIAAAARAQAESALKGNKAARSIRSKVWQAKQDRLPALQIHSKIPWLGVHERGATITGRMLIQIGKRLRRRGEFRKFLAQARAAGRTFFRKGKDGKIYLFVKAAGKGDGLGRYRTALRESLRASGQAARVKRDEAVPVAMLVNRITIKKRLRMTETVQRMLPRLAKAIEGAA